MNVDVYYQYICICSQKVVCTIVYVTAAGSLHQDRTTFNSSFFDEGIYCYGVICIYIYTNYIYPI